MQIRKSYLATLMPIVLLIVIAFRFAEPVHDGDLFWHMVYGRYILQHKTLIPDHTVYSWTPSDNTFLYCAWISEIVLFLLYRLGELPIIFVLRYICVLGVVLLLWIYARKLSLENRPVTYLFILVSVLSSYTGTHLKPELFSFVLINLLVWLYFKVKLDLRTGKETYKLFYVFPLIILIWANTHGGFIFGMTFLGLAVLGEVVNYFFFPQTALPQKALKHLIVSFFLSCIAIFITPYTYHYPLQLVSCAFSEEIHFHFRTISAYASIFDRSRRIFHYHEYFVFMGLILLSFFILYCLRSSRDRNFDFCLFLLNIAFGYVFTMHLRSTYFWPPIFICTCLYLHRRINWPQIDRQVFLFIQTVVVGLFFVLASRAILDTYCRPIPTRWLGFGIGYQNPVVEAEFIKKYYPGTVLCNDLAIGGYLIWCLYPEYKVMIDQRWFAFRNWYREYINFERGLKFETFLKRYSCDVAIVWFRHKKLVSNFSNSHTWKLAFYGPVAAVFVRKEIELPPDSRNFFLNRFENLKNFNTAKLLFQFAIEIKDYKTAWHILDIMKQNFHCPHHKELIKALYNQNKQYLYRKTPKR